MDTQTETTQTTSAPAPAPAQAPAASTTTSLLAPEVRPLADSIPEKYRVKTATGEFDAEASTRKLLEGHTSLERRMGSGDAPPKTPEEYKIEGLPEGFSLDELKKDERFNGFLKAAHAKGLSNSQVSFAVGEYLTRAGEAQAAPTAEMAATELRKVWATDQAYNAGIGSALRAATVIAGKAGVSIDDVHKSIGANPVAVRLLAAIGQEMKEDSPPANAQSVPSLDFKAKIAAISDELLKLPTHDPRRAALAKQKSELYEKQYGAAA